MTLQWTREPDDEYRGRPTYDYHATAEDREFYITWTYDAGFVFSAVRRDPTKPGTVEYLTEGWGLIRGRTLKNCKAECERINSRMETENVAQSATV